METFPIEGKIYTFKEWCDMNNYVFESKPQFIVGKWYKLPNDSNYIVKYKNEGCCSEFINPTGEYYSYGGTCDTKDAILVDVSEIQQYLPDGHVDKINNYLPQVGDWVKVIKLPTTPHWLHHTEKRIFQIKGNDSFCACNHNGNESPFAYGLQNSIYVKAQPHEIPVTKPEHQLEVGKYYTIVDNGDTKNISIICKIINNKITKCNEDKNLLCRGAIIQPNVAERLAYSSNTSFCYYSANRTYRESTSDEIQWLDRCIAANKFVPKELTKDELLEIAKQKYPVGTKIKCLVLLKTVEITSHTTPYTSDKNNIYFKVEGNGTKVYCNGKWAEIIESMEKSGSNVCREKYTHTVTELADGKKLYRPNWINGTYGIMNSSESNTWIHEDVPTTSSTTDEILRILNQYMEIEIPDTMEEVVLPQLLKSKSLITIK